MRRYYIPVASVRLPFSVMPELCRIMLLKWEDLTEVWLPCCEIKLN